MVATRSRYRNAYEAGANGRDLSPGLAALADQDPLIDQAHDAGREGADFDEWHARNAAPRPAPGAPSPPSSRRRGLSRPSRPSLRRPFGGITRGASPGHSIAGVFLGAVAYALILSVVDYGAKGPKYWFDAKFLNRPHASPRPNTVLA